MGEWSSPICSHSHSLFLLPSWQGDPPAPSSFPRLQKGESCHVHGLMKTFFLKRKVFSGSNWIRAPQPGRQQLSQKLWRACLGGSILWAQTSLERVPHPQHWCWWICWGTSGVRWPWPWQVGRCWSSVGAPEPLQKVTNS